MWCLWDQNCGHEPLRAPHINCIALCGYCRYCHYSHRWQHWQCSCWVLNKLRWIGNRWPMSASCCKVKLRVQHFMPHSLQLHMCLKYTEHCTALQTAISCKCCSWSQPQCCSYSLNCNTTCSYTSADSAQLVGPNDRYIEVAWVCCPQCSHGGFKAIS